MSSQVPLLFLEENSPTFWQWGSFLEVVRLIKKYQFNGLILHQQTLMALLAKPSPLCRRSEVEHLLLARNNALHYLQRVGRYCEENHIQLWLQGEAAPNSHDLRRKFPEYFLSDTPHPDAAFLNHFFGEALPEILSHLPAVRGLRLSLSTPHVHPTEWQQALQRLYQGLRRQGCQLTLRDYQDKEWPRQQLKMALDGLPNDVRASMKATELDYRPGFANNPNLTSLSGYRKWLEFDLWGIEYGWTLLPCCLLDELQKRLHWATQAVGDELDAVTIRMNWEWIPNNLLTDSVNELNLYGLSQLIRTPLAQPRDIFAKWLEAHCLRPLPQQQIDSLFAIFLSSHDWMCKTSSLLGRLLQRHSQLPTDFEQALQLLHMDTRSANWAQSFQPLMPADDEALGAQQMQLITLEKQKSRFLAEYLWTQVSKQLPAMALTDAFKQNLIDAWERAVWYTRAFSHATHAFALRLWIRKYGEQPEQREQLRLALQTLRQFVADLEQWFATRGSQHPYTFNLLLDPHRILHLANSLELDNTAP
ncbi:hypothetical protein Z042_09290 [Chania multitudinisentens RB-25]|uniref:Uncharacterized protein n=1 Tax=Chania multitudinisentens RB-25 TaxID=1441930 RepID=W0LJW9_9GAMM|nr:hypothetical protein [Chania multitudinisentens]AHG22729.1 hypothetical protein Z042_09290 [Chania multitudinisentens RB-25]